MLIGIVQVRPLWREPEYDGEPSAEWFHEPSMRVRFPERPKVRHLPSLPAGPLQGRADCGRTCDCRHVDDASLPDLADRSAPERRRSVAVLEFDGFRKQHVVLEVDVTMQVALEAIELVHADRVGRA